METPNTDKSAGFRLAVLVEGGLGVLAVLLAWVFEVRLRAQFATAPEAALWAVLRGVLAALPMLAAFWWLVHARAASLRRLREQVLRMVREMFQRASIGQLALVAALAGVGEELLFRGVLQTLIGRWTTPLIGLVVAAVVFGLMHALSRLYFVLATLIGLYFGWLLHQFDDLVAPIVAHALYDFVALVYLCRWGQLELRPTADNPENRDERPDD